MPLHQDFLNLARELVERNPAAPVEADLRRGISTAYHALFHLLIHEATNRLVAVAALRPRVARAFDHRIMRAVCLDYSKATPDSVGQLIFAGQPIPRQLRDLGEEFAVLQQARHLADYDTGIIITQQRADYEVMRAEIAFLDWAAVQTDPAADLFLTELLYRGIPKR